MPGKFRLGYAGGEPPSIPDFAKTYGISRHLFCDHFTSLNTFDVNNTQTPGVYNWYVTRIPSFQGVANSNLPTQPSEYNIANSILTITSNGGDEPEKAWQFQSVGYPYSDPNSFIQGALPLIDGSKPFYYEIRSITGDGLVFNTCWIQDQNMILQNIINSSAGPRKAEFDINEVGAAAGRTTTSQLMHSWANGAGPSGPGGGISFDCTDIKDSFHKWGLLCIPRAYNGGTGLARFYLDRQPTPTVPDITWSGGDTFGIEASRFQCMISGGTTNPNYQLDYIWTAYNPN